MIQLRVFTVHEANGLIPELTRLVRLLRAKKEEISKKEVEIDALELVLDEASEKGPETLQREIEVLNQLILDFNTTVDQIHGLGCFLKDVDTGLIDFYTVIEGRVVYLCWKFGEEKVQHWHEIGQGFSSRQPL